MGAELRFKIIVL